MEGTRTFKNGPGGSYHEMCLRYPQLNLQAPRNVVAPFLAYWTDGPARAEELLRAIGLTAPSEVTLSFEHRVLVRRGAGKPSFCDLAIIGPQTAVVVEARYEEELCESVDAWLGPFPSRNRTADVDGWLEHINRDGVTPLSARDILELPHQFVHRCACAFSQPVESRALVLQVFDLTSAKRAMYEKVLRNISAVLGPQRPLSMWIVACSIRHRPACQELIDAWDRGERRLGERLAAVIVSGDVADMSICDAVRVR